MAFVFRFCRIAMLLTMLLLPVTSAYAAPDILSVDQIRTGMHGIARTVVSGTTIQEFGVEVLGVMKNKGPSGDLILVRTYGDLIEQTGGIAQGMSGSPVYIDNKLIGAIGYGWSFSDHKVGMVTPIADMLKLWDLSESTVSLTNPVMGAENLVGQATPLMASGFSEAALAMLKDKLRPLNLVPQAVGDAPAGVEFGPLEPGSAVGVQLIRGDVSLGALGTVTYVEGNKVLAFGHPFLKKGSSKYFLSSAYVFTTVAGMENSFKVGTTGPAVGVVNQDRGAGIAGEIDRYPHVVPLRISVTDNTLGLVREAEAQVIQDEQLAPILAAATVFNVVEKTMDRVGPGTAKVSFEISARNMPGEVFKRDNMFYSPANIGELSVSEIHEMLTMLTANQFQSVDVMDVKVNITIDPERRTATIMQARANVATAKPGDQVDITVSLKPYRGETITRVVPFTIPKDQQPGPLSLEVRGGGSISLVELLTKRQAAEGEVLRLIDKLKTQTFADIIKELAERDHNNDVVVEILDADPNVLAGVAQTKSTVKLEAGPKPNPEGGMKSPKTGKVISDNTKKPESKSYISTDYIVDSDTQVVIQVEKTDAAATKEAPRKANDISDTPR